MLEVLNHNPTISIKHSKKCKDTHISDGSFAFTTVLLGYVGDAIVNEADVPKVDDLEKPEEAEDIQGSPLDVALLQEGELGAAGADSQSSSSSSTTTTTKATSTGTTAVTTTTTETTNVEVLRPSAASSSVANLTAAASAVILSFLYC